jgi:hypothetical protein
MNLIKIVLVFCLSFFLLGNIHAAGSALYEDFSLMSSISDDMISWAKKGNKEAFLESADAALKLSEAQRRNNSMAIDRFRPKAGNVGDFDAAIQFVQEAKTLMKPATATWDGGS